MKNKKRVKKNSEVSLISLSSYKKALRLSPEHAMVFLCLKSTQMSNGSMNEYLLDLLNIPDKKINTAWSDLVERGLVDEDYFTAIQG